MCSGANAELVRSAGADHVIDYTREDFTLGPARYDVVLDNVASHSLSEVRRVLTPTGLHIPSSGNGGLRWIAWAAAASTVVRRQCAPLFAVTDRASLLALTEMIERGAVSPIVDRVYPLAQTADAFAYMDGGHARAKVVIVVAPS